MPANVESMFYVSNEANGRFTPWHGLGTPVEEALTSAQALEVAGLNWKVIQKPITVESEVVENYQANVRDSDGKILGIVSDRYRILQNNEAFSFTDSLIGEGVRYETAGSLRDGKTVWMLAKMPEQTILDDKIDPYICFTNSHDGFGAVRVAMTPIRVVCNNTLNLALSTARRSWSTKHIGDITSKLDEARETLQLADIYMKTLAEEAEKLTDIKVSEGQVHDMVAKLLPIDEGDSERKIANTKLLRDQFMVCYFAPDIMKYLGTAYGFVNAASDFATHTKPIRATDSYQENNFAKVIAGHSIIDNAYSLVSA